MSNVLVSIACNLDTNILLAALPLFQAEEVEAIEWSFDTLFNFPTIPPWFEELLQTYSQANRLIGHGVFFSLFSGKWMPEQQQWLNQLKELSSIYHFDHITEHFGFMTGEDFHKGAPLSLPFNKNTLTIGQDRLKRIIDACRCPVGLENLAFAYSVEEVKRHGDFLAQLIEPINGFIILDLHNLYCQLHNFSLDYEDIIQLFPLDRVREIHISGGSWESVNGGQQIRRDTHDDAVPEAVFLLLKKTLTLCPNLKYVVMEQIGTGLKTTASQLAFQEDFKKIVHIVHQHNENNRLKTTNDFLPIISDLLTAPVSDTVLYQQQMELSNILEQSNNYEEARQLLGQSSLSHTDWGVETWSPDMLETAIRITQKWKEGF